MAMEPFEPIDVDRTVWVVWCPGGTPPDIPNLRHITFADAEREAIGIAESESGNVPVFILQATAMYVATNVRRVDLR